MKTNTTIIAIITAFLLIYTGCAKSIIKIEGNRSVITETRDMPSFSRIANEGAFEVYVIQDTIYEVKIEAESNLIPHIRTLIKGSTLEIDTDGNLKPNYPMKLYIRTPDVYGVALSGSGIIDVGEVVTTDLDLALSGSGDITGDVEGDQVTVTISGSGSANMTVECSTIETNISGSGEMYFIGSAHTAYFNISGSGSIKAYNLFLNDCYANISGSGNMFVNVADYLDITISGSGSIYYVGTPAINTKISGSGQVINAN
jgi:hypothetical protein